MQLTYFRLFTFYKTQNETSLLLALEAYFEKSSIIYLGQGSKDATGPCSQKEKTTYKQHWRHWKIKLNQMRKDLMSVS